MAEIKYSRARKLEEMGRGVIELPDKINFGGRESLQRANGTYWHIDLCRYRLRVAEDRLKRSRESKASTFEARNYGGVEELEESVKARQKELMIVMAGGNPEKDTLSEVLGEEKKVEEPKVETVKKVKAQTTDLDTEAPLSGAQLAKNLAQAKKSKKSLDNDE